MNSVLWFLIVFAAVGIGVWLASFVVEALRPKPRAPVKLRWAPDIPIDTIEVGGHKLRYTSRWPASRSGAPSSSSSPLGVTRVSRGSSPSIPTYYAKGRGMARSSPFGWVVTYASLIPFIGETVMRLRNFLIMRAVLRGGVAEAKSIPPALLKEMYLVGNRPGHYRAFLSLLRNSASWEAATKDYGRIDIPVLLIWGDKDWARPSEREHDRELIQGVQMTTLKGGGHFLALDKPQDLSEQIIRFVACAHPKGTAGRVSA